MQRQITDRFERRLQVTRRAFHETARSGGALVVRLELAHASAGLDLHRARTLRADIDHAARLREQVGRTVGGGGDVRQLQVAFGIIRAAEAGRGNVSKRLAAGAGTLQRFVERPIEQFHKRRTRSRHDYCEKRGVSVDQRDFCASRAYIDTGNNFRKNPSDQFPAGTKACSDANRAAPIAPM